MSKMMCAPVSAQYLIGQWWVLTGRVQCGVNSGWSQRCCVRVAATIQI